jgi:arylsulfatase A-like enzyme
MLKPGSLLALALAFACSVNAAPNVLIIAIDDLNDWIAPIHGHPLVKTPHMDRLAARGVTFSNAHCQAPLCNPSRTSLLTGLRPSTSGVYGLDPWFRTAPALTNLVTMPQAFMVGGYEVLTCGKIFHDAYPPPAGRSNGVEFTTWGPHGGLGKNRPAKKFVDTPAKHPLVDWGIFPERDEDCFDYDLATWAVQQLKARAGREAGSKPFMLWTGFRHPHVPCYAPRKWFDLYPDDDSVLPPVKVDDRADVPPFAWYLHWKLPEPRLAWAQQANQWRNLVRAYLASISFVDAQVGRVLDALDASGAAGNTIVVLWSDHGFHLGEKGITGKNTLWERSTRSPMIIAGPTIATNATCRRPAELLDIFPTLLELCDVKTPQRSSGLELEGQSLAPQLRNPNAARQRPAVTTHGPNNHSVRSERWRYIRYANGAEELYDHASDPNEWTNLASDPKHSTVKAELAASLPKRNVPPVRGSVTRLVEQRGDTVYWEGEAIGPGDSVPQ